MKCGCCITLRSAVYFGASIHVFLGALQFCMFIMHTSLFVFRYYTNPPGEPSLTLISFLVLLVGAFFFPLGCLIFRGVEKEKLSLIRCPMWIFLITKIVEISLKIYQEGMYFHPEKRVDWMVRLYSGIDIISASVYFLLLFFYSRKLVKMFRKRESDYFKSPASQNENDSLPVKSSKLLGDSDYL